jgi:hypothetical protein
MSFSSQFVDKDRLSSNPPLALQDVSPFHGNCLFERPAGHCAPLRAATTTENEDTSLNVGNSKCPINAVRQKAC